MAVSRVCASTTARQCEQQIALCAFRQRPGGRRLGCWIHTNAIFGNAVVVVVGGGFCPFLFNPKSIPDPITKNNLISNMLAGCWVIGKCAKWKAFSSRRTQLKSRKWEKQYNRNLQMTNRKIENLFTHRCLPDAAAAAATVAACCPTIFSRLTIRLTAFRSTGTASFRHRAKMNCDLCSHRNHCVA